LSSSLPAAAAQIDEVTDKNERKKMIKMKMTIRKKKKMDMTTNKKDFDTR
jgi:hypothetical protein